jgi:hypothetical protein
MEALLIGQAMRSPIIENEQLDLGELVDETLERDRKLTGVWEF